MLHRVVSNIHSVLVFGLIDVEGCWCQISYRVKRGFGVIFVVTQGTKFGFGGEGEYISND